ncbi:Striatin-3 [Strongyloides ratti]|uniref:Striatin-3 n=1 Tax=Strongyloides ratti TaxID=34506 RepID=A0A090LRY2_STRRB|nr:Striatin-3 [Strongyloides ratti]CEF70346.1 Striatin-3 [Strongyloides ratti]
MVSIDSTLSIQSNKKIISTMNTNEQPVTSEQSTGNLVTSSSGVGVNNTQEQKPALTIPGVLHYIQHEWSRIEMERLQWEIEKADLKARISQLEGETKGQHNLMRDLVRRINMLEFCLIKERNKFYKLTHNGQEPPSLDEENDNQQDKQLAEILEAEGLFAGKKGSNVDLNGARKLLRHYLSEIGYNENLIDVRNYKLKNMLGLLQSNEHSNENFKKETEEAHAALIAAAQFLKEDESDRFNDSDSDEADISGQFGNDLDNEAIEALSKPTNDWDIDKNQLDQLKEKFRNENIKKRHSADHSSSMRNLGAGDDDTAMDQIQKILSDAVIKGKNQIDRNDLGIEDLMRNDENVDIKDEFAGYDDSTTSIKLSFKYTFRSHYDVVRQMQFHPVEPLMITASEDGTAKLWNIASKIGDDVKMSSDLDPVYTFRGHRAPILSMDMSATGEQCFTADLNGVICVWNVPQISCEINEIYDPSVLSETFTGHTDAIWGLTYQSSSNRLISSSADKTIKIWDIGADGDALVQEYSEVLNGQVACTIDVVAAEPHHIVAGFCNQDASIFDIETGQFVLKFDYHDDDIGKITKILSHPTMPVTIVGGTDRRIRYFDNNTGKLIHCTIAHVESISTLAIDPNGLYLLSGSHDGSLRLWNIEKRTCIQEIGAHRKKFDMSVMSVAFHPSRPIIGSAGADSLAKIYTSQNSYIDDSLNA